MSQEEQDVVALSSREWSEVQRAPVSALHTHVALPRAMSADRNGAIALAARGQRIGDALIVVTTLAACAHFYGETFGEAFMALSAIAALATLLFFKPVAFAQPWPQAGLPGVCAGVLGSWMMVVGTLLLLATATAGIGRYPMAPILAWLILSPLLLVGWHASMRALLRRFVPVLTPRRTAVVVGANRTGLRLAEAMDARSSLGLSFKGFFDDRDGARLQRGARGRLSGRIAEVPGVVEREHIDVIYVALPMTQERRVRDLLDRLRDTTASIYFAPDLAAFDPIQVRIDDVDGLPVVAVCETPFSGFDAIVKRATDALLSALALLLLSPVLAAIAVGVKRSSPGPILFKQRRYGIDGTEILVYKFRSMRVCEDGDRIEQARRGDPRVTPFGAFLRRTSLDELPQLVNVLRGEMSLVGPRPHAVAHNEMYRKQIKGYMLRHKVPPGITGWAQVNGLRGETDDVEKMRRRLEHDLYYLRHWSLWLDIKIMAMTLWVLFRDRQAY